MSAQVTPEISVIIPTYNRKASILRTLESLGQQTLAADCFEVVVVDDGGSDGTDALAQLTYPFRILYVRQTNQGSAAAVLVEVRDLAVGIDGPSGHRRNGRGLS